MTVLGIAVTSYGLWQYYRSFETWPPELRDDLRAAVKARQTGDVDKAERKFRTALATATKLSLAILGADPLLKTTGIAIALASCLEESGQLDKAYLAYQEAFGLCVDFPGSISSRSGPERARAVAISSKLGDVALKIAEVGPAYSRGERLEGSPAERAVQPLAKKGKNQVAPPLQPLPTKRAAGEAAEAHLVWAVEELLRLSVPDDIQRAAAATSAASDPNAVQGSESPKSSSPDSVHLSDLELPPWVSRTDLLGSIESLGSFYAADGRTEYAVPLYLQALEILIPTSASAKRPQASITIIDRCRASIVMNNLSRLFLEGNRPRHDAEEFIKATEAAGGKENQALQWAKKGLALIQSTNAKAGWGLQSAGPEGTVGRTPSQSQQLIGSEDEVRTEEVRKECIRAEITLLINAGTICQMIKDKKCEARDYLQRAYRLADQEGYREARNRAASSLAGLERFKVG